MNDKLQQVIREYLSQGFVVAGEILLSPDRALAFVDDLESLGVPVDGVDFWYLHDGHPVEIPWGADPEGATVSEVAQATRRMIREKRPAEAVYVSLVFPEYFVGQDRIG